MGSLTKINLCDANELITQTNVSFELLTETKNGITDSTYIGIDKEQTKYILKIYENSTTKEVQSELKTLEYLQTKVPCVLSKEIFYYDNKPVVLFSFIKGKIANDINKEQIVEITNFLSDIHQSNIKPKVKNIYSKVYFEEMLRSSIKKTDAFKSRYLLIKDIDLRDDSFIHGDLFPDNAKFIHNKLSGVYDFGQSCFGNAKFDLSVMIISWCFKDYCFNMDFYTSIIEQYTMNTKKVIDTNILKPYLLYACLYYALQRYTRIKSKRDFDEYLKKFDILHYILK